MAISIVQTSAKQQALNVTTANLSFTGVTAGNTIIVALFTWKSGGVSEFYEVSDGDGKYTRDIFNRSSGSSGVGIFRLLNASAGTHSITVNAVSASTYIEWVVFEISSSGFIYLDSSNYNRGTSTIPTSLAAKTSVASNELILGVVSVELNQASITVESTSPVWTEVIEQLSFVVSIAGEVDRKIVTASPASYTANWTIASSAIWAAIIAIYAESSSSSNSEHSSVF